MPDLLEQSGPRPAQQETACRHGLADLLAAALRASRVIRTSGPCRAETHRVDERPILVVGQRVGDMCRTSVDAARVDEGAAGGPVGAESGQVRCEDRLAGAPR